MYSQNNIRLKAQPKRFLTGGISLLFLLFVLPLNAQPNSNNELPDTLRWSAELLLDLAQNYLNQHPEQALKYASASRKKAISSRNTTVLYQALKVEADAMQYSGQYPEAEALYQNLLSYYSETNQEGLQSDVLNELGNVNAYSGRYELALNHYQAAYAIKTKQQNQHGIAKLSNNIGLLYFRLGDFDKAMAYFQTTLNISKQINDPRITASTYTNLGFLLSKKEQHQKALEYQLQASERYEQINDKMRWANAFINIGLEYEFLGSLQKAAEHYQMAYDKALLSGHQVIAVDALNKLGQVFIKMEQYPEAFEALKQAYPIAQQLNDPSLLNELNQKFANYYQTIGDYPNALHYFQLWSNLKDSIINQNNLNRISELEILHHTAQQKQEIRILEQKNTRQRLIIIFTLITAVLLSLSGILLWSRYQIRIRLLEKDQLLQIQENKRKALEIENEKHRFEKLKVEQQLKEEENKRLHNELLLKNSELSTVTMLIYQKNEQLVGLKKTIDKLKNTPANTPQIMQELHKQIRQSIKLDEDWIQFKQHFEKVHPGFFEQLNQRFPNLTQYDHRHCAYIRMNLTTKEISRLLNITPASVQRSRVRLKKKLSLSKEEPLLEFIRSL